MVSSGKISEQKQKCGQVRATGAAHDLLFFFEILIIKYKLTNISLEI